VWVRITDLQQPDGILLGGNGVCLLDQQGPHGLDRNIALQEPIATSTRAPSTRATTAIFYAEVSKVDPSLCVRVRVRVRVKVWIVCAGITLKVVRVRVRLGLKANVIEQTETGNHHPTDRYRRCG
jgi:hypothetical protein